MAYNKSDLVTKIAQKSHLTKAQAEAAVNAFQDVFVEAMKSERKASTRVKTTLSLSMGTTLETCPSWRAR